jgi:predicted nucleic acid-binding protein
MSPEVADGTSLLLDANILVYASIDTASTYAAAVDPLLVRVARGQLMAYTTTTVLADVAHRAMLAEAASLSGRQLAGMRSWLTSHPEVASRLRLHVEVLQRLLATRIRVIRPAADTVVRAAEFASEHGLLMNDAVLLAAMVERGIEHLVTNDDDFDSVPGITVHKPR